MTPSTKYIILLTFVSTLYFGVSKLLFDKVYNTSRIVVDELFHVPQGVQFCNGNYSNWDPKITTLPGMHFASSIIGYAFPCNTYNLRFFNLIASCMNLLFFVLLLTIIYGSYKESQFKTVLQAVNLSILPPLYFFSHLYYTDTSSLMMLLLYTQMCISNNSFKLLIFPTGCICVLMRQTNVIWIAMMFGHKLLDIMIRTSRLSCNRPCHRAEPHVHAAKYEKYFTFNDVIIALKCQLHSSFQLMFMFTSTLDLYVLVQQFSVLCTFGLFLYMNGSIVIGDKGAHQATLHLPQLLYFLLFYGVFGLPYVLAKFISTIKLMFKNKLNVLLLSVAFLIVVHLNTIVHPYLLADNRHYTFYVWKRWFEKYDIAKYATVPAYIFLLFSLWDNLKDHNCISFLLPYGVCLTLGLALQSLVEIRYFLVPYIIVRMRFGQPSYKVVLFEFLWYLVINAVTFHIFFTKEIRWSDFEEVQRIIW